MSKNFEQELLDYDIIMRKRKLSDIEYNNYLKVKSRCRNLHNNIQQNYNPSSTFFEDVDDNNYSDCLLFGIVGTDLHNQDNNILSVGLKKDK